MTISTKTPGRHLLGRILMTGALVAAPIGLFAAPALAASPVDYGNGWQQDCDHNGHFGWQQNRGQWQMGDCDTSRGYWGQNGNQWQWHHNDGGGYNQPAPAPAPMFGSA
ncbi:hypothetical protein [Nocardia sp. NPDC020380]|uniref:hypothetical protein n=1 Tax=Nocardia sp. NPDC020380 TaxID=3364309 RepID=UPI0037984FD9